MKQAMHRILILLLTISLASCATPEKIAMKTESKQAIKRVAMIDIPEPKRYAMYPGQTPGGAALYMFGALGGLILGSIEAGRFESATSRFTEAVTPLKPGISTSFVTDLELGLKQKGYEVTVVPEPPKTADGKNYDIRKIQGAYDAVLIASLNGGYTVDSGRVGPQIIASVSLLSMSNNTKVFADTYIYSTHKFGDMVQIPPDQKFVLGSVDALYENINVAAAGMKDGANKLAERVLQDL